MPHCKHANSEAVAAMPVPSTLTMGLLSRPALHPARAPSRSLHYTVGPLGCPCTAESSCTPHPTPIYPLKPEFQLPATEHISKHASQAGEGLRCGQDHLCWCSSTLKDCRQLAHSPLQPRKLPYCLGRSPARVMEPFLLHSSHPGQFPSPFFLFFSPSSYSVMWGSFLQRWLYEICKLPVGIL